MFVIGGADKYGIVLLLLPVLRRYIIPGTTLAMFSLTMNSISESTYGGYSAAYQAIGVSIALLGISIMVSNLIY